MDTGLTRPRFDSGILAQTDPADLRRRRRKLAASGRALQSTEPAQNPVRPTHPTGSSDPKSLDRRADKALARLLLRAYDTVAAACHRDLDRIGLTEALATLARSADGIDRIGSAFAVRIDPDYHALRCGELQLAAACSQRGAHDRRPPSAPDADRLADRP